MANHTGVTVLLIRPSDEILMQLRDGGDHESIPYPHTWNFPGGHVEENETPEEAAVREMKEEFALVLEKEHLIPLTEYEHDDSHDHVFIYREPAEVETELHEGARREWMSLSKIKTLELAFERFKILPLVEAYLTH